MRATCYRCHKPALTCICGSLERVANRTAIWLLQHKRERHHPIGTARLAELGLANCRLDVSYDVRAEPPVEVPAGTGLLYPGRGARLLDDLPETERPSTLIILDGTWHHAHVMYRDAQWLHRLPRYALAPARASRYRIRKEPSLDCISTIEAVVEALRILEPDTEGLDTLIDAFDRMIDAQVRLSAAGGGEARRHERGRRHGRVPRALAGPLERLVVIYAESAAPALRRSRKLVQWTALRPATGEHFDELVRSPGVVPTARHLAHMGLEPDELGAGLTPAALTAAFAAFSRPDDIVVAWNKSMLDLLPLVAPERQALPLKAAYGTLRAGRCGTLDEVLTRESLCAAPARVRGRAGQRLGNAAAILDWLRRQAPATA